jgi:hypothetical protein
LLTLAGANWLMLPLGIVISTVSMLFGLGGGVLWMPVLLSFTALRPTEAVVCTLAIQSCAQLSASLSNSRAGMIDWPLVRIMIGCGISSVAAGVLLSVFLNPVWIKLLLGLTIFFIAYFFLLSGNFFIEGTDKADLAAARKGRAITLIGGLLTGFLGIGVGDWLVPFFNMRCRLAMRRAVSSAIALMLILSLTAVAVQLALGRSIVWSVVLPGGIGVLIGAQLGSRFLRRMPEARFKELFVLMLVFIAAHVTFNAL